MLPIRFQINCYRSAGTAMITALKSHKRGFVVVKQNNYKTVRQDRFISPISWNRPISLEKMQGREDAKIGR
jgi:hypothetical protein